MDTKVLVFGNTELAELNYFYLRHDSPYKVVAFTVDARFLAETSFCGLPVVPFETVESAFAPSEHRMSLLLGYRGVNGFRAEKYHQAIAKGYGLISYVSSRAVTWPGLRLGVNSYIYENAVVQPLAAVGNDVVIAPGAVIGHHCTIEDHSFVASGAVVLGSATVGPYCVLGANSTIGDGVTVGRECLIGANALIMRDCRERSVYVGRPPALLDRSSDEVSCLLTWSRDAKRRRQSGSARPTFPQADDAGDLG